MPFLARVLIVVSFTTNLAIRFMVAGGDCDFCLSRSAKIIIFIGLGNSEKRTPGIPPDVQPLIRVRMKQLHDDCESYAKIVLLSRIHNSITTGRAKVPEMPVAIMPFPYQTPLCRVCLWLSASAGRSRADISPSSLCWRAREERILSLCRFRHSEDLRRNCAGRSAM